MEWEHHSIATTIGGDKLEPIDLARLIVDTLTDKKGQDILMLEIGEISVLADYFVICSGASDRQIRALLSSVREDTKKLQVPPLSVEGEPASGWVLMDYGTVIVHLFAPEMRIFYDLEELWREARVVVRIQ